MSFDQTAIFLLLIGLVGLFIWGRLRYDLVALLGLITAVILGLVPAEAAFVGFSHPATITVGAVLIVSRALNNSGAIDILIKRLLPEVKRLSLHISLFSAIAAGLSAVMNNIGALALLMPVTIKSATSAKRSPAAFLMPLSFGAILGGLVTLIGTPPNIIIASFRADVTGEPFHMFDFTPVGLAVAVVGLVFVAFIGWRLIPAARLAHDMPSELYDIEDYVAEVEVPEGSELAGKRVRELDSLTAGYDVAIIGIIRGERRILASARHEIVQSGDIMIVEASSTALNRFVEGETLQIVGAEEPRSDLLKSDDMVLMEAVVTPRSSMEGRTIGSLRLAQRYGVNLLAVSRQGRPFRDRLRAFTYKTGDIVLLQGDRERLPETIAALGCLPLAMRELGVGGTNRPLLTVAIFAAAIGLASVGVIGLTIALTAAALALVVLNIVPPREMYEQIDWPVIIMLGALIPVGGALESTGGTKLIADTILALGADRSPVFIMVALMVVTMTLSDVMNNAATAVVMAPIGVSLATQLGVNTDPFLMVVAVAASCAFLTPIGHQNNAIIMGPGGYHFGDYWRMGLPLEILIVAVSIPVILVVWPL